MASDPTVDITQLSKPIPMEQLRSGAPEPEPAKTGAETGKPEPKPQESPLKKIAEGLRTNLKDMLKGKTIEPKKEPEPEKPGKPEKTPEEAKPAAEPAKPKKSKARPEDAAIRAATEAASAARAATELLKTAKQAEKPEPERKVTQQESAIAELPDERRKMIPVLERMEKGDPGKYRDLTRRYIEGVKKAEAYAQEWKKQNPGADFDPQAEEHDAFFEKNEVTWEDEDFQEARTEMRVEKALEKQESKVKQKLDEIERKETAAELQPQIQRRKSDEVRSLVKEFNPDLAEAIDDNARVDTEKFKAARSKAPLATDIVMGEAAQLARFVEETKKLFHESGRFEFDGKNPVHDEIYRFAVSREEMMLKMPEEDRVDDSGRMFATRQEYSKMSPEERSKHWQLTDESLIFLRKALSVEAVKGAIAESTSRLTEYAAALGLGPKSAETTQPKSQPESKPAAPDKPQPRVPSAVAQTKTDTLAESAPLDDKSPRSNFKKLFRGMTIK